MATEVWGEHFADLNRAVRIVMAAAKALGEQVVPGEPGHWSDLEFEIPPIVVKIDGVDTGWRIQFIQDMDDWGVAFE